MTPIRPITVAVVAVVALVAAACRPAPAAPPPAMAPQAPAPAPAPAPTPAPPPPADAVTASPEVYQVLAESESARLLLATWQPGQRDAMHSHTEFVVYLLTDMTWQSTLLDGSTGGGSAKAGEVLVPAAGVDGHAVQNVGDAAAMVLILERKAGAAQPAPEGAAPSAVEASPKQYVQLADTEWVRVVRGTWDAKARDTSHSHPETFAYSLTNGVWRIKHGPRNHERVSQPSGAVQHLQPTAAHSVKNVGKEPASMLFFELK